MTTGTNPVYDSRKLEDLFHGIRTFVHHDSFRRPQFKTTSTIHKDDEGEDDNTPTKNASYEEVAAQVCDYIKREFYPKYKSKKPSSWDVPGEYQDRLEEAYIKENYPDLLSRLNEAIAKRSEVKNNIDHWYLRILEIGREIEELRSEMKDLDGCRNKLRGEVSAKKREVYDTVFKEIERERNAKRRKTKKT